MVDALRHTGTNVTADGLRDYLIHSHGYIGIHGVYDFRSGDNRGLTPESALMLRYDKTQKLFVPVSKPGGAPLPNGG